MVSILAMAFEVVGVVIKQYMPRGTACDRWFWVRKGSDHVGGVIAVSL